MHAIKKVFVLVDWDNVKDVYGGSSKGVPAVKHAMNAILRIQQTCHKYISLHYSGLYCKVRLRFYDGWHCGFEESERKKIFNQISQKNSNSSIGRKIGNVLFEDNLEFGSCLIGGDEVGTLYNTYRSQGQKMVDTAIVCDSIFSVSRGIADSVYIISSDDDFIPVIVSGILLKKKIFIIKNDLENYDYVVKNDSLKDFVLERRI